MIAANNCEQFEEREEKNSLLLFVNIVDEERVYCCFGCTSNGTFFAFVFFLLSDWLSYSSKLKFVEFIRCTKAEYKRNETIFK